MSNTFQIITQLRGQHEVAAKLLSLGYIPALLPERTVGHDMLVLSPKGRKFGIEVKTNRQKNAWFCRKPTTNDAEFWVFVTLEPTIVFNVMTRVEVTQEWGKYQNMKPRKPNDEGMTAAQVAGYGEDWGKLPP